MRRPGTALLAASGEDSAWELFSDPVRILRAHCIDEVEPLFHELERLTAEGFYAAGFVAYEAAPAFDSALTVHEKLSGLPLAEFAVYDHAPLAVGAPDDLGELLRKPLEPELSEEEYGKQIADVLQHIHAGDIYQANLTFRCRSVEPVHAEELFLSLAARHPVPYAAFLNFDECRILSLSPELFLESDGCRIFSSPMKGTAKRSPIPADDRAVAEWLAHDEKNMAENLMITDMVRNDLGRVCVPGSISVDPLLHVDTYGTVHQMISTVHGGLPERVSLFELFSATFPPASITGAPKVRAMEIIRRNEKSPRGVYTGCIGVFRPGKAFRLNVAIRTLTVCGSHIETGIGGGIVADSTAESEWKEALLKRRYAEIAPLPFRIFETIRWTAQDGYADAAAHIHRAVTSQRYFGRPVDSSAIERGLSGIDADLRRKGMAEATVKFLLDHHGNIEFEPGPGRGTWRAVPLRVLVSSDRTDAEDIFLHHKTTVRDFYHSRLAAARAAGFDEVIFRNTRGEFTEGSISNLFIRRGSRWYTPPLRCGLLPGVERAHLLASLPAEEKLLFESDLRSADEILLCNSVRGAGIVAHLEWS